MNLSNRRAQSLDPVCVARLSLLLMSLLVTSAHAVLSVNEPWVRAAPDGRTAEMFVRLKSSDALTLTGVDTFASRRIEMRGSDGKRGIASIGLPANELVELKPGAMHLRMTGLHRRLRMGEHVPVTLVFTAADGLKQTIYVNAEVRLRSPTEDEMSPSHGAPGHRH